MTRVKIKAFEQISHILGEASQLVSTTSWGLFSIGTQPMTKTKKYLAKTLRYLKLSLIIIFVADFSDLSIDTQSKPAYTSLPKKGILVNSTKLNDSHLGETLI
jgi:hypothetical protein